jgi:hypothetical protein
MTMAEHECGPECNHSNVKLDGSLGLKERVRVTIVTKDDIEGERREGFIFPKALVNMSALNQCAIFNIIKGYEIVNQDAPQTDGD